LDSIVESKHGLKGIHLSLPIVLIDHTDMLSISVRRQGQNFTLAKLCLQPIKFTIPLYSSKFNLT
jgi:hypothetical protein